MHSQHGEDEVLLDLTQRLGITNGFVVEFGAGDGSTNSNTLAFIERGWSGLYVEPQGQCQEALDQLAATHDGRLTIRHGIVGNEPGDLDRMLEEYAVPQDFDILSIDVEGDDYYIWQYLEHYRPKIVVIEIDGAFPYGKMIVQPRGKRTRKYGGASFSSMVELARKKGYTPVRYTGNLIAVRNDLADRLLYDETFHDPNVDDFSWETHVDAKIGVVIPCHNHAKYLRTAMESVLPQSYMNWHMLVVDDASTDGTSELVHEIQKENPGRAIQLARSDKNIGLSGARNKGIEALVECQYILPLDADDWLGNHCLTQMNDVLESADVAHAARVNLGMDNAIIPVEKVHPSILPLVNQLGYCSMFRRSLWEKVGGYPDHFPEQGMEDWQFWIRCMRAGARFRGIAEPLWFYRVRAGSMSRTMDIPRLMARMILEESDLYAAETVELARKGMEVAA